MLKEIDNKLNELQLIIICNIEIQILKIFATRAHINKIKKLDRCPLLSDDKRHYLF